MVWVSTDHDRRGRGLGSRNRMKMKRKEDRLEKDEGTRGGTKAAEWGREEHGPCAVLECEIGLPVRQ